MSQLATRILLAVFLIPFAAIVYILVLIPCVEIQRWGVIGLYVAGLSAWAFICIYWVLLWRSSVLWLRWRMLGTLGAAIVAFAIGVIVAAATDAMASDSSGESGALCASMFVPIAWVVATVFVWRETAEERQSKVAGRSDRAVACPTCGYNLTGLTATRCPECGKQCTLDELFAAQTSPYAGDIER